MAFRPSRYSYGDATTAAAISAAGDTLTALTGGLLSLRYQKQAEKAAKAQAKRDAKLAAAQTRQAEAEAMLASIQSRIAGAGTTKVLIVVGGVILSVGAVVGLVYSLKKPKKVQP